MQGLVVVGLIFEQIPNINVKCVKVTGVQNTGQDTCGVSTSRRSTTVLEINFFYK